jgi:serine/threonine-protein kinase
MNEPRDPNRTVDGPAVPHDPSHTVTVPSSAADELDAGLAAGFGPPRSSLGALRPLLLREAEGESAHIVQPQSDAMPPPEQTGDRYQLQGEIARGGMGAVLRGRDVDLGRDLAVKVLLEKHAHRPEVARRFIEEAQIGGQLQHPGVVPVYDIGRFGQRPFFTMKLVKGKTLAALLGERTEVTADRPRFLGIALQVAQTLAYAHAKGVIHRDLKPANIMVGAFGEVQVMDWGLAKVLAEGGVADEERQSRERERAENVTQIRTARSSGSGVGTDTEAGSLLGTPAYMPPEQANGDVANLDRRADVFGLGAILCEILTGKPPYVGRSTEEVRRKACNGDLADATARLDACGTDAELVALTKTCLAAEAIDRPKDAQAVADGLAGYLNGVQERLHQAELAEAEAKAKAIEEAKRRRLTLALAGTVLLALTLGGGGWLYVKNERDARQAQVAREVNDALHKATALCEQAKTAPVGNAALFAQAREQVHRALALVESGPADDTLKTQVTRLQSELDEEEKDRKLIATLDEAHLKQAETLSMNRFATERAVPLFREAFRAYGLPVGEGDPTAIAQRIRQRPTAVREAIVAVLDEWDVLAGSPKIALAEPHREWLRAVLSATEPEDAWTRQLRDARAEKDKTKRRAALAALVASVDVEKVPIRALTRLAQLGALGEEDALKPADAVKLLRRVQAHHPGDFWVNENLGAALQRVTPPEQEEAVRFLTAAVALRPDSPGAHLNLGGALKDTGQWDEAIACCRKAIELDPKYAAAHFDLGIALGIKGQWDGAIACSRKVIELDPKDAFAHANLGNALLHKGQWDEAIACCKKALQLDPKLAVAHIRLGVIFCNEKRDYEAAIASYRKALELDPKLAAAYTNLGIAQARKGQVDEAIASHRKAVALAPKDALVHNNLGGVLCDVKRDYDGAIVSFRTSIELDPKNAHAHFCLGNALRGKGQLDAAIASYRTAIELDPKNTGAHTNLGNALKDKGQLDEAIACYRKAIALDPKLAAAHNLLGALLCDRKHDYDAAIASFRTAIALDPKNAWAYQNLGVALRNKGQVDAAIASFRTAIALDPKNATAQTNLAKTEGLVATRDKFAAFQKGSYPPASNDERLGLIEWCKIEKLHRTAARLYADAFAADPKLVDDLKAAHRYSAACLAALAAAGLGEDAAKVADKERTRLRQQALDWLRADLALRRKQLDSDKPADRAAVQQVLRHWHQDSDLAGIRDKDALAKLPAEERAACEKLWAGVAALLKKAEEKAAEEQQLAEAGTLAQRGLGLLQEKKWADAEPLLRQSLALRAKMQPDAWPTFNTQSMLGGALLGQKKYADAEPLLLAGYEGMKQRQQAIPPPAKIRLTEADLRLVQLYETLEKKDEVARWTREREALQTPAQKAETKP